MNKIVVSYDPDTKDFQLRSIMYVSISRASAMNGLFFTGKYNTKAIRAAKNVTREYKFLREHQTLQLIEYLPVQPGNFVMTVCNVRSL